jgi:2-polyprenyl-6-methoxyphenol hydroxylase-like FAD-dependent oxidoreductase
MEPLVVIDKTNLGELDADVAICGGPLGIFIAVALQKQGHKVILLERGKLKGREQEWNISRPELQVFLDLELLSETELDQFLAAQTLQAIRETRADPEECLDPASAAAVREECYQALSRLFAKA